MAHNKRLESLGDKATRGFRAGNRVVSGHLSGKKPGLVMHVNPARGADDDSEITVLYSDAEDVVKLVRRDELTKLLSYRGNYTRMTKEPSYRFTYEQLRDSWCAHLSRSLSRRATH